MRQPKRRLDLKYKAYKRYMKCLSTLNTMILKAELYAPESRQYLIKNAEIEKRLIKADPLFQEYYELFNNLYFITNANTSAA